MKRKVIIILLIVIAIIVGLYFLLRGKQTESVEWRTAPAEKGIINLTVTATGTLQAVTSVLVGTQVSGTIYKLFADYNDHVKAGQMIALIDTSFLSASLLDARAAKDKAQVLVDQSKLDYDRINELYKNKVASQADYDQSLSTYKGNLSLLNSALAQLTRAKINLEYAKIRSPIDGIVISRNVDIGQTVAAAFNTPTIFVVANDLTKMQINAYIDETDIGNVKVGQKVFFTVDAYPGMKFRGDIVQLRLQPIVIQNVVNYSAIINAANPDLKLMPGMTANITIDVDARKDVIKIPSLALRFIPTKGISSFISKPDSIKEKEKFKFIQAIINGTETTELLTKTESLIPGDTSYVWVKKNGKIDVVKVVLGISDGTSTEINSGIKLGDEVVVSILQGAKSTSDVKQNPFMPKMPGPRRSRQ